MRKLLISLAAILFVGLLGLTRIPAQASVQPQNSSFALTNVTVIDATSALPKQSMTVVVSDGRINGIGKTGKLKVPRGTQVVDAKGKFLIPGLWDMHVHLAKAGENTLPLFVANGVTSVRDMGGDYAAVLAWRREILSGSRLGPRIKTAGPLLAAPRKH